MKVPSNILLRTPKLDSVLLSLNSSNICGNKSASTVLLDAVSVEALNKAKPFQEIPGPKSLPLIGNIHRYLPGIGEYSKSKWHEAQRMKFQQYGPIVREQMVPGVNFVHLYDPKDMEVVSRNEGKFPKREFFVGMKTLRERNPEMYSTVGVAAGNGEEWYRIRSKSQKAMMRPQIMKTFLPQMNLIADDLIRRIRLLRQPDHQVPLFLNELFKWALESVTYILFEQRLGCLEDNLSPDSVAQQYIQAVNSFFQLSAKVELSSLPVWRVWPALSPSFRKLANVHDFFFENALKYVQTKLQDLKNKDDGNDNEDEISQALMSMLLQHCSPKDACVMAVDAMAAGIDTTSLTLAYVLRNLAANPEVQKRLQGEVDRVLPDGQPLTVQAMDQMPYLRACIKESMRICPTVQGTSRTLDKDIVLSGYRIPAETQITLNYYVSSVQERYFPDADKYIPERWLRSASGAPTTADSFAFQPFGFGPRMCIGRRIADLEMLTLLTKIMQNFWIENQSDELDVRFQLVLMIQSPLRYEFYERR
ncbi:probable cytochrome P450 301a1, mitochondrial [Uloborus diversus]|uniref:probable cytochrome P450 301a1, mitochondrial n=1 Tax=Uloborus diversus TaxID=327109 RepID=UPI002409F061|nr:probable cytochrome P450 301a1, mitochondrial [Uloborus diversus]